MGTWRAPGDSPLLQLLLCVLPEGEREKMVKSFASFHAPHEKNSCTCVWGYKWTQEIVSRSLYRLSYLWNFSEASSDFVLSISSSLTTDSERRVRSCSIIDNLHNGHNTVILEEGMPYSVQEVLRFPPADLKLQHSSTIVEIKEPINHWVIYLSASSLASCCRRCCISTSLSCLVMCVWNSWERYTTNHHTSNHHTSNHHTMMYTPLQNYSPMVCIKQNIIISKFSWVTFFRSLESKAWRFWFVLLSPASYIQQGKLHTYIHTQLQMKIKTFCLYIYLLSQ